MGLCECGEMALRRGVLEVAALCFRRVFEEFFNELSEIGTRAGVLAGLRFLEIVEEISELESAFFAIGCQLRGIWINSPCILSVNSSLSSRVVTVPRVRAGILSISCGGLISGCGDSSG
ncbi:MAG: hypothetical protein M2R45_03370 [Verrucomicrobia subdivision 3 bacterium]|nr:hypothetical protein [Limisphaerales bacterium]MCS1416717.1 hypothetical protein [Limisphaerales bacterium]